MKKDKEIPRGQVVLYRNRLEVRLEKETVWLSQPQIAQLFGTKRPAITKHLSNIFKSKELQEKSVCSILEHTAADGKVYKNRFYNLDIIISAISWRALVAKKLDITEEWRKEHPELISGKNSAMALLRKD